MGSKRTLLLVHLFVNNSPLESNLNKHHLLPDADLVD